MARSEGHRVPVGQPPLPPVVGDQPWIPTCTETISLQFVELQEMGKLQNILFGTLLMFFASELT